MTGPTLVIGYGNSLRSDDGIGPAVAAALSCDVRAFGVNVIQRHQLTPELAADLAASGRVIMIDAQTTEDPGPRVSIHAITPVPDDRAVSSHHLDPATLLALTKQLYGCAPTTWLVSVRGDSFAVGDELTTPVRDVLPLVVETALLLAGSIADA